MNDKMAAGFWVRLGARVIDGLLIGIVVAALNFIIFQGFNQDTPAFNSVGTLYYVILPALWAGYTVGKKAVGVRIVKQDGTDVGFGKMILREVVGGLVYILTLGIGAIVSAFMVGIREDKRAIHDFIGGTYVTHREPETSETGQAVESSNI
ncbi:MULTISPECIES: RDD family protein [Halobacillus]|uniref:RDD family protein n=1 Tax=Halobacillus TaxID=45667 RepID=UPI00136B409F|nr:MULTISPECIES: RDD family protein [Halobacillus]MCA1021042.1 RDD family protein [Halobacillus litoralis]MYL30753.1 RDD family protein [Halobacillus halophilus]MYL36443.1 RDD family protein [Halobacillus litoralis]